MAAEVEEMKRQYEDKLRELEHRARTAKAGASPVTGETNTDQAVSEATGDKNMVIVNEEQKAALEKYDELCMTEIFLTCCCPG